MDTGDDSPCGDGMAAGSRPGDEGGGIHWWISGGGYVMGGDIFAFPKLKDAGATKAQYQLATSMLTPETQIIFVQKKGPIAVRLDVDSSSLDVCAQKAMKWLVDAAQQLPSQEMLAPPAFNGAIEDIISQYWNTPAMTADQFVAKVQDAIKRQ